MAQLVDFSKELDKTFDRELELSVPPHIALGAVMVDVDIMPRTASCLIYGVHADGTSRCVRLNGGHSQVSLPFAERKVYLKYSDKGTEVRIGTIGHIDRSPIIG